MNITIFGVGRSGTKAVQLYLSYLMALKNEEVWINYEPYFWMRRYAKNVNFEGYYQHIHSPHFIRSAKEFSPGHLKFLKKLKVPTPNLTTKFIRGNGRMDAINEVLEPNHSMVIVRDLYQVLVSVLKTEWDFWSVGFEYTQKWETFVAEVRKRNLIENFDWCLDQVSDRLDQNAFYWYAMNKAALQSFSQNLYYINYANIKLIEHIAREVISNDIDIPVDSEIFDGDNIHENFPLSSKIRKLTFTNLMNVLLYQTKLMNKYGLFIPLKRYGTMATINKEYQKIQSKGSKGTKIIIEKKDLFEFFNEDIQNSLRQKEWLPVETSPELINISGR